MIHPLKYEIIRLRLRQKDIAHQMGLHQVKLCRLLNGTQPPSPPEQKMLARYTRNLKRRKGS